MGDMYHSVTVVFEQNVHEEDIDAVTNAIRLFNNVLSVQPNMCKTADYFAEERVRHELGKKLIDMVYGRVEK